MNCWEIEDGKYYSLFVSIPVMNHICSVQPENGWNDARVVYGVGLICDCGIVHQHLLGRGRLVLGCGIYNIYAHQCNCRGYIKILRSNMGKPINEANTPEEVMLIKLVGHFHLDLDGVDISRINWTCMVEKKGHPNKMIKRQFSAPDFEESGAGWEDGQDCPRIADMTAYFIPTSV